MSAGRLDERLIDAAYRRSGANRWSVTRDSFGVVLEASVARTFADEAPDARHLARYVEALHVEDLALACACAAGNDEAWEHFIRTERPALYRAADAIDRSGRARELADALYADLYGVAQPGRERPSLFRYFHGRSSLATWLRAVLAQRHVDRMRAERRIEALPEEDAVAAAAAPPSDPDRARAVAMVTHALGASLEKLPARDRLRVDCYYARDLTLAAIGRMLGEHEATVSRHLTRTRKTLREGIEQHLRNAHRLSDRDIDDCIKTVAEDSGGLDLSGLLASADRKKGAG